MAEPNPFAAPQVTEQIVKTTVAPVNKRQRQHPWEEPLRTKLSDIARHQRMMIPGTGLLILGQVGIGAWMVIQKRGFPVGLVDWVVPLLMLLPMALLLMVTIYQLVVKLDDGDVPAFMALTMLVPLFNLLVVFYFQNLATGYLRESGIASGWTGISAEQFAAQVELLREAEQGKPPAGGLPVAEEI